MRRCTWQGGLLTALATAQTVLSCVADLHRAGVASCACAHSAICLSSCAVLQRAEAEAAAAPGSAAVGHGAASQDTRSSPQEPGAPRILRTYGQRRPKADARSEAAPVLAPDVLALIAGKGLGS